MPGPSGVIFWPSLPYLRPLSMLGGRNILPPLRQKEKVPHELPFCDVVAGPLGGGAPGVDRVKSAGVMQIHRPLPFSFG